ncbi:unnamed protein product, partial [Meganyctiphanes norvegica]
RIDRMYTKNLSNYVKDVKVKHTNISDHSCVIVDIDIPNTPKNGPYYWKMNTSLLENKNIKKDFILEWVNIKNSISKYENINIWWELCAKKRIKSFFIRKSKELNQQKY